VRAAREAWCATIAGSAATRCLKDWLPAAKQVPAGFLVSNCIWYSIIVALKLTPGNVSDTAPVPELTKDLVGKLFGDKGDIGRKLAHDLLRRGLALMTRVRRNIKSLPVWTDATSSRPSSAISRSSRRSGGPNTGLLLTPSLTLQPRSLPIKSTPCLLNPFASLCHELTHNSGSPKSDRLLAL
jgi:Transposase DDE domain